jgi:hypothetical protein
MNLLVTSHEAEFSPKDAERMKELKVSPEKLVELKKSQTTTSNVPQHLSAFQPSKVDDTSASMAQINEKRVDKELVYGWSLISSVKVQDPMAVHEISEKNPRLVFFISKIE